MIDISNDIFQNITRLAAAFAPMLLGIVLHEVAHGFAAYKLGDPTAKLQGRLTLNPVRHLDMTGSLFFIITALLSPFIIGWAKPVQVQPRYCKNPRQGMMLISFAGPATNFLLAIVLGGIYAMLAHSIMAGERGEISVVTRFLLNTARIGMWVNVTLGWFNLMPIPGLDGGHILAGLLPARLAQKFYEYSRYGMIVLIVLLATGALRSVMGPIVAASVAIIGGFFSIPPQFL
jgi:Zn-dependent protease